MPRPMSSLRRADPARCSCSACAGLVWFALAFSASAESPSPSADVVRVGQPRAFGAGNRGNHGARGHAAADAGAVGHAMAVRDPRAHARRSPLATRRRSPRPSSTPTAAGRTAATTATARSTTSRPRSPPTGRPAPTARRTSPAPTATAAIPGPTRSPRRWTPRSASSAAPSRDETVGLCGSCHANVDRMKASGLPTDQYAKYWSSVHGQRLLTGRRHPRRDLHRLPRRARHQEGLRPDVEDVRAEHPGPVRGLPRRRPADAALRDPDRPVRHLLQERPRRGAAREQGRPGPELRLLPRLARRQAADVGHGRRGVRQVPHRHPGAVPAEPPLRAPGGGPEVLDLPRHPRRLAAELAAVLPPRDARTTPASRATTSRRTRCGSSSAASRTPPTGAATPAITPIRRSTPRSRGSRPP